MKKSISLTKNKKLLVQNKINKVNFVLKFMLLFVDSIQIRPQQHFPILALDVKLKESSKNNLKKKF